jgi:hypothetical protein
LDAQGPRDRDGRQLKEVELGVLSAGEGDSPILDLRAEGDSCRKTGKSVENRAVDHI